MATEATHVLLSPRISALQRAVEAGDPSALDRFWDEIAKTGAPLIEPLPDRDDIALGTILWRADEATTHVVFYSELLRGMWWNQWEDALLFRLPQTNLFYRTYCVCTNVRFVYWIAPNHPLYHLNAVQDWESYVAHWQLDPLNPRVFVQDRNRSYVEMPAAPPQPWFQPRAGIPAGQVEQLSWHSTLLENDREVWIYTPSGYQAHGDPLPLLVLFDGDIYTSWVPAPTICDNLIAAGHIPPLIMVMLNSPHRAQELYCDDGFVTFLIQEFYPWIRQTYRVTDDPRQTIVGGMSAGGLAAAFVGLRHPEIFGNVLSQSGAFGWSREPATASAWSYEIPPPDSWLIEQYATTERLPVRFYLDAGLLEDHRDAAGTSYSPRKSALAQRVARQGVLGALCGILRRASIHQLAWHLVRWVHGVDRHSSERIITLSTTPAAQPVHTAAALRPLLLGETCIAHACHRIVRGGRCATRWRIRILAHCRQQALACRLRDAEQRRDERIAVRVGMLDVWDYRLSAPRKL